MTVRSRRPHWTAWSSLRFAKIQGDHERLINQGEPSKRHAIEQPVNGWPGHSYLPPIPRVHLHLCPQGRAGCPRFHRTNSPFCALHLCQEQEGVVVSQTNVLDSSDNSYNHCRFSAVRLGFECSTLIMPYQDRNISALSVSPHLANCPSLFTLARCRLNCNKKS